MFEIIQLAGYHEIIRKKLKIYNFVENSFCSFVAV